MQTWAIKLSFYINLQKFWNFVQFIRIVIPYTRLRNAWLFTPARIIIYSTIEWRYIVHSITEPISLKWRMRQCDDIYYH